jgi:phosphatidylglycerophosphate synthase
MLGRYRENFRGLSVRIGALFSRVPLSPNGWTLLSLFPAFLSALFLAANDFAVAALLFGLAASMDFIDGSVARVMGRTTKFGAYLDTVTDRYVEFIIIFGLFFASLPEFAAGTWLKVSAEALLLLYLFGSLMTTYAKSAASEKGLVAGELKGGAAERAERMLILFAGIALAVLSPVYLVWVIALLAALSNLTALQRILAARKAAKA